MSNRWLISWLRWWRVVVPFAVFASCHASTEDVASRCCPITIEWRAHPSLIADDGARSRLEHRLTWVADRYREHGVCVDWQRGPTFDSAAVYSGGERAPQLQDVKQLGSARRPRLLLVPHLVAEDEGGRRQERKGATPGAGANVAVVRIVDGRGDGMAVRNELLHIFGLTDAELGVTRARSRHMPTLDQWRFVARVCEVSGDEGQKRRAIVAKEECLSRSGERDRGPCYRGGGGPS